MKHTRILSLLLALVLILTAVPTVMAEETDAIWGKSPISEPYDYVSSDSFSGEEQPYSPDPLVSYRWENPGSKDELEIFLRKPVSAKTENTDSFSGVETLMTDDVNVKVNGAGTILLDFGTEFAGWLEIDSPDLSGTVTLGVSEYNEPAFVNSGPRSPSKTAVPKQYGDTYRLELNSELYEGVRFGFINVTNFDKPFTITDVRLVCQVKPVNYEGSFDSDSEMLNKIWYTAAYDVRVNLRKDYFAAILMDRGDRYSWTGDAYPAQAASLVAFGNFEAVLDNLKYTSTRGNGIESYELYWVLSLIDYYEYTGDAAGVRSLLTQAGTRLDHAYNIYGKNPNLGFIGWDERLGGGFEFPNIPENQNIYMLNCIRAWSEFAEVLDDLGETASAAKYRGYAEEKTAALLANENWADAYGLHAAADAINAGITDAETTAALFEAHFTDRVNRLSYSPFNQYFLLQAMGKAGEHEGAVSAILDMFGGQVEYGGTTFFENYRPQWNDELETNSAVPNNQAGYTSLAHPWGAGVLTWMSEELLGIKADSAGFKTFTVKPHLTSEMTRVSGSTPTGNGIIKAAIDMQAGTGALTVPAGTTATYAVPKAGRTVSDIRMNGEPAVIASEDADFYYITGLTEGTYAFTMTYTGEAPEVEELEWIYPAKFVREDATTQGNWVGTYGSEGYVLCGSSSTFGKALPDYVESVTNYKAKFADWTLSTDDPRALSAGWGDPDTRVVGAWYCANPSACWQTFTVDIDLKEDRPYTVALYFVDWDLKGREVAVEVFDGETLDMIAPVKVVSDYENGKYLIYEYDKSLRFRIDHVRGDNATLSGIFFGEGAPEGGVVSENTVDDQDAVVSYAGAHWTHDPMNGAYLNTFSYTNVANATATYTFTGTGVTYLASKEFNRGIAEVILDGVSQGEIDLYSASALRQQKVFSVDGLENTQHTIQIRVTGKRNGAAAGAYVDVDGFTVRKETKVEAPILPITVAQTEGGTVQTDLSEATYGQTVSVTAEPAEGYKLISLTVYKTDDPSVTVEVTDGTFKMPVYGVTVKAEFETPEPDYDLNKDGVVNLLDIVRAQRFYGQNASEADLNKDGIVDIEDLILILNQFL